MKKETKEKKDPAKSALDSIMKDMDTMDFDSKAEPFGIKIEISQASSKEFDDILGKEPKKEEDDFERLLSSKKKKK